MSVRKRLTGAWVTQEICDGRLIVPSTRGRAKSSRITRTICYCMARASKRFVAPSCACSNNCSLVSLNCHFVFVNAKLGLTSDAPRLKSPSPWVCSLILSVHIGRNKTNGQLTAEVITIRHERRGRWTKLLFRILATRKGCRFGSQEAAVTENMTIMIIRHNNHS